MNPSVARRGGQIMLTVRCVNYWVTDDGQYKTPNGAASHTRNYLLRLDGELRVQAAKELLPPADMPAASAARLQDPRLFAWRDRLWCSAGVRDLAQPGWCEQMLACIADSTPELCRLSDWRMLRPEGQQQHEKNWMPQVAGDKLQFIYLCDPTRVLDEHARTLVEHPPAVAAEEFRGGSQAIPFDGGWLALIHEVALLDGRRVYQHRFVWFDASNVLRRVSRRFFFHGKGIEFAAGLAWHPDGRHLIMSYGVDDREAWIATADAADVRHALEDVEQFQSPMSWPNSQR
jgi:hypothetical protein